MNELYGTPKIGPGAILNVGGCAQSTEAVSSPYGALTLALSVEIDRLTAHVSTLAEHLTPVLRATQPTTEKRDTRPPMRGTSQLAVDLQTKVERVTMLADALLDLERRLEI
jgi:hypothetical protein